MESEDNTRVIGLLGEMSLAMALHERGWQVYRAYIDEQVDFIIARYYCRNCGEFSNLQKRKKGGKGNSSFPTNLCEKCGEDSLMFLSRFVQVKASEGVFKTKAGYRSFSFHAKLRSNVDDRAFYAWVAIFKEGGRPIPYFYIFNHKEIDRFDDLNLASYQETDNQKTTLRISPDGKVINKGRRHNYDCFNEDFLNNFDKLKKITTNDLPDK